MPSTLPGTGDTTVAETDTVRTIPMSLRVHLLASSCQSLHPWAHGCFLEPMYRAVGSARELKPSGSSSQAKTGWSCYINTSAPLPPGRDLSEVCFCHPSISWVEFSSRLHWRSPRADSLPFFPLLPRFSIPQLVLPSPPKSSTCP